MKPPRYLAFDPGSTIGYAYFDSDGISTATGQYSYPELLEKLHLLSQAPKEVLNDMVIIVENFELLPHKAMLVAQNKVARKLEVSKAIGALEIFAKLNNSVFVLQPPEKNTLAKIWTGLDANVNHSKSNWKSAYNHGIWYLVSNKLVPVESVMRSGK